MNAELVPALLERIQSEAETGYVPNSVEQETVPGVIRMGKELNKWYRNELARRLALPYAPPPLHELLVKPVWLGGRRVASDSTLGAWDYAIVVGPQDPNRERADE